MTCRWYDHLDGVCTLPCGECDDLIFLDEDGDVIVFPPYDVTNDYDEEA